MYLNSKEVIVLVSSAFNNFIDTHNIDVNLNLLPLFHSCEGYNASVIFKDDLLKATPCNVFTGENLLYFFYGKPAYPVGAKQTKGIDDSLYCPVCFIVNPEKVKIYRVFPFDSGACKSGKYSPFMHRDMQIEDFELKNCTEAINKYVAYMFGTVENYISGKSLKKDISPSKVDDLTIMSLIKMHNACGYQDIDERALTVEVILKDNIRLEDAVECAILPKDLLLLEEVNNFLTSNNIPYKTYTTRRFVAPIQYNHAVFDMAMEFLNERGLIKNVG